MNGNLADSGFDILSAVLSQADCNRVAEELAQVFADQSDGVIAGQSMKVVGGRNLQSLWQGWRRVVDVDSVTDLLRANLGDQFGLVRILFFDKPPGQSWNLALHRDRTIAVARHHDPPAPYGKPTRKAGVPHVAAEESLLERMLTLRLHLDAMHASNGPLVVVPGSHRNREHSDRNGTVEIHCNAGDVFVMRPLLLHGSRATVAGCPDHRRVVHLEFASHGSIADPYRWFRYDAVE